MPRRSRTDEPFDIALPRLLHERGLSIRGLAKAVDVNQSHLSRLLGAKPASPARRVSRALASAVARELDLPEDYFPEYRELAIVEAIRADPALRDRIFDQIEGAHPRKRR